MTINANYAMAQVPYGANWELSAAQENLPEWFTTDTYPRGGGFGIVDGEQRLIYANRDVASFHDATDGSHIQDLSVEGLEESLFDINVADFTEDGKIIGAGLTLNPSDPDAWGGGPFNVHLWDDVDGDPVNIISYEGNDDHRLGDQINVVGSYEEGTAQVIAAASQAPYIYVFSMENGEFDDENPEIIAVADEDLEGEVGMNTNAYPVGEDQWLYNANSMTPALVNADGSVAGNIDSELVPELTNNVKVVNEDGDTFYFITLHPNFDTEDAARIQFVRVPEGNMEDAETVVVTHSIGDEENANASGAVDYYYDEQEESFDFFIIELNNGTARFSEVEQFETLADLTENAQEGEAYNYSGEAIVTYVDRDNRNQHYIADETGAIVIDDAGEVLGEDFSVGDGIQNLVAEFSPFGATRQLVPQENPGVSSSDNELPVFEINLEDLDTNDHQSKLVEVAGAEFLDEGEFENGNNYEFIDPTIDEASAATFTTHSLADDLDYYGYVIPQESHNLRGIVTEFQGNPQLTARSQEDFVDIELQEPEPEPFTVYYNNPEGWDDVYAYAWEDEGDPYMDWPGELMDEPEEGSQWYSYDIPVNYNRVIFNNGDDQQTEDLVRNETGWYDGYVWFDEEPEVAEYTSIAEMLEDAEIGDMVRLTNEAYLTFNSDFRNRKVVVDPTGGIVFDDSPENMSTDYNRYDGLTGITGTLGEFNGLIQLQPFGDAEVTSGDNAIFPNKVSSLAEVDSTRQGELVYVENVSFEETGEFENGVNYTIIDEDDNELIMRTDRIEESILYEGEETYIGTQIPQDPVSLVGYVGFYNAPQLTVRKLADFIDPDALSGFELQFPENEATMVVEGPESEEIPLNWTESESDGDVTYQWMAQVEGLNYTPPQLTFPADDDGAASQLSLARGDLDGALEGVGLEQGEELTVNWTVVASEAGGTAFRYADEDFTVTLERGDVTSSEVETEIPDQVALEQNYPNPFNPATTIQYQLPSDTHVELTVYNMLGQQVTTLVNDQVEAGTHEVTFDGSNLASGVYLYRLQAGGEVITNQMTLVK